MVHVPYKTPKCIHLILHHQEDGSKNVTHTLDVTQVKVVLGIRHQYRKKLIQVNIIVSGEEWMDSVCPDYIFIWKKEQKIIKLHKSEEIYDICGKKGMTCYDVKQKTSFFICLWLVWK